MSLRRKRKAVNNDGNPATKDCSSAHSNSRTSINSEVDTAIISQKYFNDTVPEKVVRSTLPSELAEEYLLFVKQCGKRQVKDDAPSLKEGSPGEQSAVKQLCCDNDTQASDHMENQPALKQAPKPANSGTKKRKGRRRKNRTRNLLVCLLCSTEFETKQEKQDHYNQHFGSRGFECTYCTKAFQKMPALVSHVSRIHLIDKQLACKICGKKFRREWLLRSHSLTHTNGRKFCCPTCKRGFTHKRPLFEHISGHVGFNPYKCEECGKRFQSSSYLSLHRRSHVAVRPFKCSLCNVQCTTYSAVETHKLLHTENQGFLCEDCNVRIPAKLKTSHIISHDRKKSWTCDVCPAKFHAESVLKDHLRAHSCIVEYKCDLCEKEFESVRESSDHVCPKWQRDLSRVEICPVCKTSVKKECWEGHKALCRDLRSAQKSDEDEQCDWSSPSDCTSDGSDDENSRQGFSFHSVWLPESEPLDLDGGVLQKIKLDQCPVEEDTDDEELSYNYL